MKSDEDIEIWGKRQRQKGGMRVLAVGAAAIVFGVVCWRAADDVMGSSSYEYRRFVALGAIAIGAILAISGIVILVGATRGR